MRGSLPTSGQIVPEHTQTQESSHDWRFSSTEDTSICLRCGLVVLNTVRFAGWDEELVRRPCD